MNLDLTDEEVQIIREHRNAIAKKYRPPSIESIPDVMKIGGFDQIHNLCLEHFTGYREDDKDSEKYQNDIYELAMRATLGESVFDAMNGKT